MIAYADNSSARRLAPHATESTTSNCAYFARLVENALGLQPKSLSILSIRSKYWEVGTHYIKSSSQGAVDADFFERARHPQPNVMVVGEAVSERNRGWVEGALESVDAAGL